MAVIYREGGSTVHQVYCESENGGGGVEPPSLPLAIFATEYVRQYMLSARLVTCGGSGKQTRDIHAVGFL